MPAAEVTAPDVVEVVGQAAAAGHTLLPVSLAHAIAPPTRWQAAVAAGQVAAVPAGSGAALGYARPELAETDEQLAAVLGRMLDERRVGCVVGPAGRGRTAAVERRAGEARAAGAQVVVVDDAERDDVVSVLQILAGVPADALVLLAGDLDTLPAGGPGQVLADLVAAGRCPVATAANDDDRPAALAAAAAAIRQGRLVSRDPADRSLVVVTANDEADAVRRTGQLVATSIPRAFGLTTAEIAVLTPVVRGPCGRDALAAVLADVEVVTVHEAVGRRWPAVVLLLGPRCAGVLSRPLLVAATATPTSHLSVVHGVGGDLPLALAQVTGVRRETVLGHRLRDGDGVDTPQ
ncbi:MAG: hypothetical protein EPO13_07190 [Actinomycetota bacterium]|nr:MAG: hypothetical protein EPO13_07190 [Actinomycetota bacterium]